jgi:protein-S-isoprenylcysteine O-methyltransferase Ste14
MQPWQRNSTFYLGGIATGFLPWVLLFGINAVSGHDDIAVNAAIAGYCLTLAVAIVVVFNIQYPLTTYWRWAALGLGTMCVVTALVTWFISAHANL